MNVKANIKIIFFYLHKIDIKIFSYRLSFQNSNNNIESNYITYEIPEEVFKYGKDKTKIFVELYDSSNKMINKIEFYVYYHFNTVYIQIDGNDKGVNFDMIFKNPKEIINLFNRALFISLNNR